MQLTRFIFSRTSINLMCFVIGWLILGQSFAIQASGQQQNSQADKRPAKQASIQPAPPTLVPSSTLIYPDPCAGSKKGDEENLCLQVQSLVAYRDQVFWAECATFVGFAGIIGISLTLFYTMRAAKAAELAATIASTALEVIEQPYPFVSSIDFSDDGLRLCLKLVNHGKTPAILQAVTVTAHSSTARDPAGDLLVVQEISVPATHVLGPDDAPESMTAVIPDQHALCVEKILAGSLRLDLVIAISYGSIFNTRTKMSEFSVTYDFMLKKFIRTAYIRQGSASMKEQDDPDSPIKFRPSFTNTYQPE